MPLRRTRIENIRPRSPAKTMSPKPRVDITVSTQYSAVAQVVSRPSRAASARKITMYRPIRRTTAKEKRASPRRLRSWLRSRLNAARGPQKNFNASLRRSAYFNRALPRQLSEAAIRRESTLHDFVGEGRADQQNSGEEPS